jgi:hypothetical protein
MTIRITDFYEKVKTSGILSGIFLKTSPVFTVFPGVGTLK